MTIEPNPNEKVYQKPRVIHHNGASGAVYGLGLIGAWVYFISHATTFWIGVLGFLKGLVWPAMLVYELLKYLNM
jgi:hypothetical protein